MNEMKKSNIITVMMAAAFCCFAEQGEIRLPAFETWNAGNDALVKTENGWLLNKAKLRVPGEYPVQYGDSVVISMKHSGKGSIAVCLNEFDENRRPVTTFSTTFANNEGKTAVYSPFFEIRGKEARYFTLTLDGSRNADMVIEKLTVLHHHGENQKLFSPVLSVDHWQQVTQGTNLAAGKKVRFYPVPNRAATKEGDTDETDLTDGKLSTFHGGCIHDDKAAVGWQHPRLDRCAFSIDLGSVQPVGKAVLRICGGYLNGTKQGSAGMFPERIDVWISKDGKDWYKASYLQKLQVNEQADSDWNTLYYLPEGHGNIRAYAYPFQLNVNAEARFIYFDFSTAYYIFVLDEAAVLEGDPSTPGFNAVYSGPSKELLKQQAALTPYYSEFYVARNVNVPNFFRFDDNRDVQPEKEMITYSIDLPSQIRYIPEGELQHDGKTRKLEKTEENNGRVTYHFSSSCSHDVFVKKAIYEIGPFYFRAEGDVPESEKYIRITTFADGKPCGEIKMKLNVIDIPEVPQLKHLMMAGTWFTNRVMFSWPDTMNSMRHLGFNALSVHGQVTPRNQKYLEEARANGFKIIGVPNNAFRFPRDAKCTNWETFRINHFCPSYRGEAYQFFCNEIIEKGMKSIQPDYIHMDYEFWFSPGGFASCERCEALRKSKNMSRKDFAEWVMADSLKGILEAARRAAPQAVIANYLCCMDRTRECGDDEVSIFGTRLLYPEYLDDLHPSCYQTNIHLFVKAVRTNYLYTRDPKKVLIYLTAGNGAYFTEEFGITAFYSLLEAYMNGAYAVAYFVDRSFASPIDYYYVTSALKLIAPYDEFLVKATLDENFKGSNPDLTYTLRKDGKDALLLVGNYQKRKGASTFLPLPGLTSAVDCKTGEEIRFDQKGIELPLDKYQARLLKLTF